jgi:hypothetical protein
MRHHPRLVLAALTAMALAGCGGGSGGGGTTGTPPSGDPLASGRAALNRVASGASPSDTATLQGILAQFQQALQQKPNSADAQFGIALCLAGEAGNGLDGGFSAAAPGGVPTVPPTPGMGLSGPATPLPAAPTTGEVPPAPPGHTLPIEPLPPAHQLSLLWNIDSGLANPYALLNMLAPIGSLQYGLIPFYGYAQDTADVARRQKLLANLDSVVQHLQAVEATPDFSTTLPDPNRQGQMVSVGLPEVYLFDAYVNSLRAEVALSLAYVRDPGGIQLIPTPVPASGTGTASPEPAIFAVGSAGSGAGQPIGGTAQPGTIYLALDKNRDGKLTPDEYLPASPYLTLRDPALLTTAQQAMQTVVDKETKGISGVLARPAGSVFLVSNTPQVQQLLSEVRDHVVPLIQQAATGPITIELPHYQPFNTAVQSADPPPPPPGSNAGGVFSIPPPAPGGSEPPLPPIFATEKVTVNLAAWFAHPPADLKVFAPTYLLNSQGIPDISRTTYPDATFGGLYPNGLPKDLVF